MDIIQFIVYKCKVFICDGLHWKTTNSTTMTFAAFVDTLKEDRCSFFRWTKTNHPYDFNIFIELGIIKRRKLICPIPSISTHGETALLAPGINWERKL